MAGAPGAFRDGFVESGHAIGEGAAVLLDDDLNTKLNTIYGTDVSGAQATLFGLRTVTAVAGAAGAAKAVSQIGKGGAKLIETVEDEIEAREAKKAKEQEIAERKEKLNFEKDSFEVENRPVKEVGGNSDQGQKSRETTFYTTPEGQVIEAPPGYVAVTAQNGKGLVLLPEGQALGNNANIIRYGSPSARYPRGYFRYYNEHGQPVNPATGKPGSQAQTHITPEYDGPLKGYPGKK